jgi:rSAM/selenodomain-associated transferase 2
MTPPLVSVIVPALDEEVALPGCLAALQAQAPPLEVIVVDGGSRDATRALAAGTAGVTLLESDPGRATQMNRGAAAARGELLWFVHADCRPLPGSVAALRGALAHPHVSIGSFRFALDAAGAAYRLYEWGVALRVAVLRQPYGDQGLFMRARDFAAVGGYPELPLFEDARLVRALRRRGRLARLRLPLPTSARRWERIGLLRTSAQHLQLGLLERLGVPVEVLARRRARSAARARGESR